MPNVTAGHVGFSNSIVFFGIFIKKPQIKRPSKQIFIVGHSEDIF